MPGRIFALNVPADPPPCVAPPARESSRQRRRRCADAHAPSTGRARRLARERLVVRRAEPVCISTAPSIRRAGRGRGVLRVAVAGNGPRRRYHCSARVLAVARGDKTLHTKTRGALAQRVAHGVLTWRAFAYAELGGRPHLDIEGWKKDPDFTKRPATIERPQRGEGCTRG
jgi:hypothetical protein